MDLQIHHPESFRKPEIPVDSEFSCVLKHVGRELIQSYATRLVRRELFTAMCEPDHCCILEENRLIVDAEDRLRDKFLERPEFAVHSADRMLRSYLRRMFEIALESYDFEDDLKDTALARFDRMDFSRLFLPENSGSMD